MLKASALAHPSMIQMWKCKLRQQQRLGLAGSCKCNPSSFSPVRHPLRKGPCPERSARNRTEGLCICLHSTFFGVAACLLLFLFNASVWGEAYQSLELSSSSHSHMAAKGAGGTLLWTHCRRAESTAAPSLSMLVCYNWHPHDAFYFQTLTAHGSARTQPHHLGTAKANTPGPGRDCQVLAQTKACPREAAQQQQQEITVL